MFLNNNKSIIASIFFAFCLIFIIVPAHALDVPVLQGYVNDYAGMLSPQAKSQIEAELRAFEQSDSTQIVILTIPSLEGENLEDFSIKVADAWKIGQKEKDNGVIFLVAKQERKIRIEVGRGLEGKLTDLLSGRIIDLVIKPKFKRGDFDGGFIAGVHALIDATRGEFTADKIQYEKRDERASKLLTMIIFGTIILIVTGSISRILSILAGAVGLPLFAFLTFTSFGIFTIIIFAIFGALAGFILPSIFSSTRHHGSRGFFHGGGFYWGGGSSGIDFGGGFSGGGGSFGGGGASGDW
jgi:uncharacterized protein